MKKTAKAPANIAFIKYWGKRDEKLRLPANSSISMNLSNAYTVTSVEFNKKYKSDSLFINHIRAGKDELIRVSNHLNLVRNISKTGDFAKVESKNNFPKGSGIASSASGFAALTVAAASAAGLKLSEKDLSVLARLGSGSACRSIPDGIVEWRYGSKSTDSYAHSLYPVGYWELYDVIAVAGKKNKKTSSTEGHKATESSPFYKTRISGMEKKIKDIKNALKNKDFTKFGEIIEAEALNMHTVMMTSIPPLYYWMPKTLEIMQSVINWREKGLEVYFTIDAGPNVHIICQSKDVDSLREKLKEIKGFKNVIVNSISEGAHLVK